MSVYKQHLLAGCSNINMEEMRSGNCMVAEIYAKCPYFNVTRIIKTFIARRLQCVHNDIKIYKKNRVKYTNLFNPIFNSKVVRMSAFRCDSSNIRYLYIRSES